MPKSPSSTEWFSDLALRVFMVRNEYQKMLVKKISLQGEPKWR